MLRRLLRWLIRLAALFVIVVLVVVTARYIAHRYRPGSVIVLELDGPLAERASPTSFGILPSKGNSLDEIRTALTAAQDDPRIVGLAIKIYDPTFELAQAQELADLVTNFRARGKWTTAYMETAGEGDFGNLPYLVASSADEVSLMPQGEMNLIGVSMREVFARGFFDWIKVKPIFDAIGKYKTAANIFTEKDFTPPQREEDEAVVGSIFDQLVNQTADFRHLEPADIRSIVNRAPLTAADSVKARLVDRLEYDDQFTSRVRHYRGEHHDLIDADSYVGPGEFSLARRPKIAVIYGIGAIERGSGGFDPLLSPGGESMGSDDMVDAFKQARRDNSIRAVVFRIDSPGGSVIASELIRRQVELCAQRKPVIVSMGSYAASGGFWIATPAQRTFAEPGTITGSIGVLGGKFNISGGVASIGIDTSAIQNGQNAAMFDQFTDFTPEQAQLFHDRILGDTYSYFLKLVAKQRHMTTDQVNELAQGRVWTGVEAARVKLIDHLGNFDAALAEAKLMAKIDPHEQVQLVELPQQVGPLGRLFSGKTYSEEWHPPRVLTPLLTAMREALARQAAFGEAYCPFAPRM